jgi:hypothetical protein
MLAELVKVQPMLRRVGVEVEPAGFPGLKVVEVPLTGELHPLAGDDL